MIAVDTNVIAYLFLRGEFATRAEAWLTVDSKVLKAFPEHTVTFSAVHV